MALLLPTYAVPTVLDVSASLLRSMKVRAILLDVDNTLSKPGSQEPFAGVEQWVESMQRKGFVLTILSNNFRRRVAPFANRMRVPFLSFACKPLPGGYWRAISRLGISKKEAVVVGDQVFTDVLGANLSGVRSILLAPAAEEHGASIRLRRSLETSVRRRVQKLGRYLDPKE